jgi:uncharacterized protein YbbC (DUF1343 family)
MLLYRLPLLFAAVFTLSCTAQHRKNTGSSNTPSNTSTTSTSGTSTHPANPATPNMSTIIPAAHRVDLYLPLLKGKNVAVFANQTSTVGNRHLVDVLKAEGVKIKVIFGPEHGFRGNADAGEKIGNYTDKATGLPVVSLYGSKRKPSKEDLAGVDVMVFDIQDVGVRFYTYISSLQEYMETALEYNLPLVVLDRPNPNGHYVDGPVLDLKYKSFIGMQPVPVVYGMTMGEYAQMILMEGWLSKAANDAWQRVITSRYSEGAVYFQLHVIPCDNYDHKSKYVLPVKPSPNLPAIQSVYWYPSTCFFEGTVLSEGRGTDKPFQVFGHPSLPKNLYSFTPTSREGAKEPKLKDQLCYGWQLDGTPEQVLEQVDGRIQLKWLLQAYKLFPDKSKFFIAPKSGNMDEAFFNKLAGNNILMKQVQEGASEEQIRKSWQPGLQAFKEIRKRYLIYPDFE